MTSSHIGEFATGGSPRQALARPAGPVTFGGPQPAGSPTHHCVTRRFQVSADRVHPMSDARAGGGIKIFGARKPADTRMPRDGRGMFTSTTTASMS